MASAVVKMHPDTVAAVRENRAPKGDPLAVARVAATQAAKNTPDFIPYCHPLPVEHVLVEFDVRESEIECLVTIKTVYKTGVEVEAMAAAAIGALNIYDLLKPIDDEIEILNVKLISKIGGKTDWKPSEGFTACVLTVSDRCSNGEQEDISGSVLKTGIEKHGGTVSETLVVPDDQENIAEQVSSWAKGQSPNLILITGGTGIGPRDKTPEAITPLLESRLAGIEEQFRRYSQDRMPTAMLSRCVAGIVGSTVVIALPGSPGACQDAIDCLFPGVIHSFAMLRGDGHE